MNPQTIFSRSDHDNGMRLRILVTNKCDKRCNYCLNDFQLKGDQYASLTRVQEAIREYSEYCSKNGLKKTVTFSGGEPGLWPYLKDACRISKSFGCETKVCTNGKALERRIWHVDLWHVHIFDSEFNVPWWCTPENTVLQYVITDDTSTEDINDIIRACDEYPLKFFVDFYSPNIQRISEKLERLCANQRGNIYARYTGVQPNRGTACGDCELQCITLKGIWLFPDGDASSCPQRQPQAIKINDCDNINQNFFSLCHSGHSISEEQP